MTYNTGLVRSVLLGPTNITQRLPYLHAALAEVDADFVCFQEVWLDKEQRGILASMPTDYGHHVSFVDLTRPLANTPVPCNNQTAVANFGLCIQSNCGSLPAYELISCVTIKCGSELVAIAADFDCYGCLLWQLSQANPTALQFCASPTDEYWDNTAGVMLFSKHPLKDVKTQFMPAWDVPRGYIYATATVAGWGDIAIACTHVVSFVEPYAPPPGYNFKSVQEESLAQANLVMTQLLSSATPNRLLLGDLNAGPEAPGISAELPQTFAYYKSKITLKSLFDTGLQPRDACSWCRDNFLVTDGENNLIDYIGVAGFAGTTPGEKYVERVERVFTEITPIGIQLSDHYGVKWTKETAPTCSDGIHNGDEEAKDCGGSCDACLTQPECDALYSAGSRAEGMLWTTLALGVLALVGL